MYLVANVTGFTRLMSALDSMVMMMFFFDGENQKRRERNFLIALDFSFLACRHDGCSNLQQIA